MLIPPRNLWEVPILSISPFISRKVFFYAICLQDSWLMQSQDDCGWQNLNGYDYISDDFTEMWNWLLQRLKQISEYLKRVLISLSTVYINGVWCDTSTLVYIVHSSSDQGHWPFPGFQIFIYLFNICVCLPGFMCTMSVQGPTEARRRCWSP